MERPNERINELGFNRTGDQNNAGCILGINGYVGNKMVRQL